MENYYDQKRASGKGAAVLAGGEEEEEARNILSTNESSSKEQETLRAPIAFLDDGFSSDGAFISGAETEIEISPACPTTITENVLYANSPPTDSDDTDNGVARQLNKVTVVHHHPHHQKKKRYKRAGSVIKLVKDESGSCSDCAATPPKSTVEVVDQISLPDMNHQQHPIYNVTYINQGPSAFLDAQRDLDPDLADILRDTQTDIPGRDVDESRTSLLNQQESIEDLDDILNSSHDTNPNSTIITKKIRPPKSLPCHYDEDENMQMRRQFEAQALNRPRCTTPVSSCTIESFIASSSTSENQEDFDRNFNEKIKISLPGGDDGQKSATKAKVKSHSRKSSTSWTEFYVNMTSSTSGRTSGRTTPTSMEYAGVDGIGGCGGGDIFDTNPAYQYKVPPSPVVHRRSSTEWVGFEAVDSAFHQSPSDDPGGLITEVAAAFTAHMQAMSSDDYDIDLRSKSSHDAPPAAEQPSLPSKSLDRPEIDLSTTRIAFETDSFEQALAGDIYQKEEFHIGKRGSEEVAARDYDFAAASVTGQQGPPAEDYYYGSGESASNESNSNSNNNKQPLYDSYYGSSATEEAEADGSRATAEVLYAPVPRDLDDVRGGKVTTVPMSYGLDGVRGSGIAIGSDYGHAASSDDYGPETNPDVPATTWRTDYMPRNESRSRDNETFVHSSQDKAGQSHDHEAPTYEATSWDDTPGIRTQTHDQPLAAQTTSWDDEAPPVPKTVLPPPPPPPAQVVEVEKVQELEDAKPEWHQFLKMSEKITENMKQTQKKLQEIEETSVVKELPQKPYSIPTPPQTVDDLMEMKTEKSSDSVSKGEGAVWRPIHERLNEEIKKEKELRKPKRPPLPKDAPQRPNPMVKKSGYATKWDDDDYLPPPPPCPAPAQKTKTPFPAPPPVEEPTSPPVHEPAASSLLEDFVPPTEAPASAASDVVRSWADFDNSGSLPSSESGFFQQRAAAKDDDPFAAKQQKQLLTDFLGAIPEQQQAGSCLIIPESYDPFDVKSAEEIVTGVKSKIEAMQQAEEARKDLDFFGAGQIVDESVAESSKLGSETSPPTGFSDDFAPGKKQDEEDRSPSPLYDEDDSVPLTDFPPKFTGQGWELMLRYPLKKKIMNERYWKSVFVKLEGNFIQLFNSKNDKKPFQDVPLQSNYCLSDITLQQYDIYGKIHSVKVQYVLYKERVGVRPGQIPKLVEGKFTKLGLPVEHAAQTTVLLKFGSLAYGEIQTFVNCVEDLLFRVAASREQPATYKQDEIQVHCYDEYSAEVSKTGLVTNQQARVRLFCLSFVSGMPFLEIGLNDYKRQGKEVVRRKDIMPMYTERWIRFECLEFHSSVDPGAYAKDHMIRLRPLDACFFEVLRFRVRPPKGKELPLQVIALMKIAGSKIEIRLEAMVAAFKSRKAHQVPCEDIQIRFPIPEAWIYLFREEKHWGYGSVHAKVRRPGKVKNIKDKLMGIVQHTENSLIEAAIGDAKYEHVHRALVWRIPKLPEKHHGAYKTHLLRCRFQLNSFDLMPESFVPHLEVEYTMPMATVSHTVVRSVSIEQHEDPDRVEKWVRYVAKYQYKVEIDYVQTSELDIDAIMDSTVVDPEKAMEHIPAVHKPSIDVDAVKELHSGYRIEFAPGEFGRPAESESAVENSAKNKGAGGGVEKEEEERSSSDSDEEENKKKFPAISIDMKGYGY